MNFFEKYKITKIPTQNRAKKYWILNIDDKNLKWSNDIGWVETGYTIFNEAGRRNVCLPIEGEWNK